MEREEEYVAELGVWCDVAFCGQLGARECSGE